MDKVCIKPHPIIIMYVCMSCDTIWSSSWEGAGEKEKGMDKATGKVRVEVDPKYYRPTEVVSEL